MEFELTNQQRIYFGLEPIDMSWDKVKLKGDTYRSESILYFDGDVIKRHIIFANGEYKEQQYDEPTRSREILLPKTNKGKEKKLTASVLELRQPTGVYCNINSHGRIYIASHDTQTTFYDSRWSIKETTDSKSVENIVEEFIATSPENHISQLNTFKSAKRKNVKFKAGDFFAFKISLTEYGFGRVLLNIDDLKKKTIIDKEHGLGLIMAKPILVKIYAHLSVKKDIALSELQNLPSLPSDYMMDNLLFYGQFEIIGWQKLQADDFDFPMSYGRCLDIDKRFTFLQWGLIYKEIPIPNFNKYLTAENPFASEKSFSKIVSSPYRYSAIGFYPLGFDALEIKKTIMNSGVFSYENPYYTSIFDLRNPKNSAIRNEIMEKFGLDSTKTYDENCLLTNTIVSDELIKMIR